MRRLLADTFIRFRTAALTCCLFAFVVSANWATFDRFGSDMPDWDQWDAEALNLFAPWYEHDHFAQHLLEPHNEHRVVLTKLQNLAVCLVNGQWDARVECLFNALLHGFIAVAFWVIGRRWIKSAWQPAYFVAIAALYGLPLAWQNLLGGFHSQQYWLIGLSFAAMLLVPFSQTWSGRWWLGVTAAILALGSMGSGFLAAAVIVGIVAWQWLVGRTTWRAIWPTLGIMIVLIAVGLLTRVEVPYHQALKAKTAHDFTFSILRSLEWPLRDRDWAGIILWAPWLIIAVPRIIGLFRTTLSRHRRGHPAGEVSNAELVVIALGGWVLIQLLATAYARGANADYPASRYMDTLIFATAVNALAAGWLLSRHGGIAQRLLVCGTGIAWLGAVVLGCHALVRRNVVDELPSTKVYYTQTEAHLRGFLATNDPAELADPIPYPSATALMERLKHKSVRQILPESVRPAIAINPAGSEGFVRNDATQRGLDHATRHGLSPETPALAARPTWGSFSARGATETGQWRSAPLQVTSGGWLKLETAGDIGRLGVTLELQDAATGARIAAIAPTKVPGNTWRSAYVRTPSQPFVIVAQDSAPDRWLAFSTPVEMGRLSYPAWQLMKNGLLIAEITGVIAVLLLASVFVRPNSR